MTGRCAAKPKPKPKPRARAPRAKKGGLEEQLGLTQPLYPEARSLVEGARAQFERAYGPVQPLRRAGGGPQNLGRGRRARKAPQRFGT